VSKISLVSLKDVVAYSKTHKMTSKIDFKTLVISVAPPYILEVIYLYF